MATRRTTKKENEAAPVDPALALILQQMEAIAATQRLMAQELSVLRTEQDHTAKALSTQLVREKQAAEEGLKAAMEQMYKHIESLPMNMLDVESTLALDKARAERDAMHKRERFTELLKTATRGQVINYQPNPVPLTINGVTVVIQPGVNLDVPAPFIEHWEDITSRDKEAAIRAAKIAGGSRSFGYLEDWRASGRSVTGDIVLG